MSSERTGARMVAGYRVLRTLAHGDRADLLLGHEPAPDGDESPGTSVALKVLRDASGFECEVEALSRARGEHVVQLLDVASSPALTCLVLERLAGPTLADLLDRRTALDGGEIVTILAPLAEAVIRMHSAGVSHGRVSAASVVFRTDGAPVLTGFGAATLHEPGSPEIVLEDVPGVARDRAALRDLALLLLGRVGGELAPAALRFSARLGDAMPSESLPLLAEGLFELAEARPVRLEDGPRPSTVVPAPGPESSVGRTRGQGVGAAGRIQQAPREQGDGPRFAWLAGVLPDRFRDRLDAALGDARLSGFLVRWRTWTPARRRAILGAAAGLSTVLIATGLLPSTTPDHAFTVPAPTPVGPTATTPATTPVEEDPLRAAIELLRLRDRCLRDLSVLCLDDVDQAGSAALETDRAAIRAVQDGEELPAPMALDGDPILVERLGDSVLVDLPPGHEVRSLLLFRTSAGWRIRDYLPAGDG